MPLLPPEPCHFPTDLFAAADPAGVKWWVLHTKPRAEKAIARSLFAHQVPFFLPTYENKRRAGGRVLTSHLPLFAGYMFLRGTEDDRGTALGTNQIANCIPATAHLRGELEAVYRVMTCESPFGPETPLVPGAPIKIVHGPLAGIRGKVLRRGNRVTVFVEVQMLKQGVAVEIEEWMVAPDEAGEAAGDTAAVRAN
jgi:transcriptional antiterminator RfaH